MEAHGGERDAFFKCRQHTHTHKTPARSQFRVLYNAPPLASNGLFCGPRSSRAYARSLSYFRPSFTIDPTMKKMNIYAGRRLVPLWAILQAHSNVRASPLLSLLADTFFFAKQS